MAHDLRMNHSLTQESLTSLTLLSTVCSTDDDCTDGTCTNNGLCECDENEGYRLVSKTSVPNFYVKLVFSIQLKY